MKPTTILDNRKQSQKQFPLNIPPNSQYNPYGQFVSTLRQSERILDNYKIISWEKNFQYNKIAIQDLDSIFVNSNPFFQELISLISVYNDEVEEYQSKGIAITNGPWRSHFFIKLHNILMEIVFTRDRILQNYFIETVHSWALDQISRTCGQDSTTASSKAQGTTQRPLTGSTNITRPQSGFPENFSKEQAKKTLVKRPGSAIITQGVIRPISGIVKNERPVSGALQSERFGSATLQKEERPASSSGSGNNYKYIRPLSGWKRPLSSITRPWSSNSGEIIENVQETEDIKEAEIEAVDQEQIHEVKEEPGDGEEEEEGEDDVYVGNENELLPSQFIKNMMKDYKEGARTKIDYVDAPYERLKNYERKNLLKISSRLTQQNKEPEKIVKPEVILYDKPIIFLQQQQKYREQKEEEQKQAEILKAAAAEEKKLKAENEEEQPEKKTSMFGKPKKKKRPKKKKKEYPFKASMIPDHKPYQDDDLFKVPRVMTAQTHLMNKFETKSTFLQYQPSDDPRELNMELKWFYNRNKELNDKRVDEEMVTMVKEWSSNKERIEVEISRKIQSEYDASQFQKIEYKPNKNIIDAKKTNNPNVFSEEEDGNDEESDDECLEIMERKRPFSSVLPRTHNFSDVKSKEVRKEVILHDVSGLEANKAKRKIEEVRKLLGGNINANNKEEEDKGKMPKSLSIYSTTNNLVTEKKLKVRPFSAFIQSQKPSLIRNEQMFEINEIKEKMARYKLPANTKVLINALMVPEGLNDQEKLMRLPMPGSDLIKNPFADTKKKKRKKGKKKKKKY